VWGLTTVRGGMCYYSEHFGKNKNECFAWTIVAWPGGLVHRVAQPSSIAHPDLDLVSVSSQVFGDAEQLTVATPSKASPLISTTACRPRVLQRSFTSCLAACSSAVPVEPLPTSMSSKASRDVRGPRGRQVQPPVAGPGAGLHGFLSWNARP